MTYDPKIHHRRSIRLKGYDYSRAGLYFITVCSQDRLCLFGRIGKGEMKINDAGNIVLYWWGEMQNKYRNIELHERVIMPNHFHGIIEIKSGSEFVGANLRVRPNESRPNLESDKGQTHRSAPTAKPDEQILNQSQNGQTHRFAPTGSSASNPSVDTMVQWFKTMTTNGYIRGVKEHRWSRFNEKLWQRNYYEHIIRDEKSYLEISEYIQTNPAKWQDDKYFVI
ncbi:MAG: hypothetical protein FP816_04065 [Desulfobacteraceae bacterium]|nr:hypothetical protein [Desulfobacteraceae bacterium]